MRISLNVPPPVTDCNSYRRVIFSIVIRSFLWIWSHLLKKSLIEISFFVQQFVSWCSMQPVGKETIYTSAKVEHLRWRFCGNS